MDNVALELWKARLQEMAALGSIKKLKPIKDDYLRGNITLMIENQQKHNETETVKMPNFIKQFSILATIHTISAIPNIFSLQVFKGPDTDMHFYFKKAGDINSIVTQPYHTIIKPNILMKEPQESYDDDEIAYQSAEIALTMANDIIHYGINDMISHAKYQLTSELHSVTSVMDVIKTASDKIKEEIGRPANFVVLPTPIASYMKSEMVTEYDFGLPLNIRHVGCLKNKLLVYMNSYEHSKILVGYRGLHPADAGYILSPALQFCEPKKDGKDRYVIHRKANNAMVRPDYFACVELTADKRSDSIEEF